MRVLVIEDDEELAAAIAAGLRLEGLAVDTALDGVRRAWSARWSTTTT